MKLGDWGCGDGCGVGDTRKWNQNSIYIAKCGECNEEIEFFKDDKKRRCSNDHLNENPHYGQDCC